MCVSNNVQIERTASGDTVKDEFFSQIKPGLSFYETDADAGILYQLDDMILQTICSKTLTLHGRISVVVLTAAKSLSPLLKKAEHNVPSELRSKTPIAVVSLYLYRTDAYCI